MITQYYWYFVIEIVPALDCDFNDIAIENAVATVAWEPIAATPLKLKVYFTCNEGYQLYGLKFRICVYIPGKKNRFVGLSPVCRRKSLFFYLTHT